MARSLPLGWRSAPTGIVGVGFWRPLVAVLAGLFVPALTAWVLLALAGEPAMLASRGLRYEILFVLYALFGAPAVGFFLLPLLWALALAMAARGWAGLLSVWVACLLIGLPVLHIFLHGDLTTEAPSALPRLVIALLVEGFAFWVALWSLLPGHRRVAGASTGVRP